MRSIVAKVMWIIEVVGFSVGYSELERQTRAYNLLEFGWAQSGKRRNCVDLIQKNVCSPAYIYMYLCCRGSPHSPDYRGCLRGATAAMVPRMIHS